MCPSSTVARQTYSHATGLSRARILPERWHQDVAGPDDGEITGPIVTRCDQAGAPLPDRASMSGRTAALSFPGRSPARRSAPPQYCPV
jgi:hypothetical protein